ncbi:hypothetical protein TTHERM_00787090 (macronuclear) [Tetrahymena thermophila SB210]|uniref:Uncharacterized protein n=1 Tax=Tetrahymena thermophila (strain SB210) TaxID=312017 RepID=Q23ZF4_TETTS|nr:hypothetical protein TTHERM_00787090 [Tetrahymena thermophila SB210]EAS01903.2 hypothetical protein TTHERM_00787090 [Tetrahymena thermophila SB210]|eukprot:XP_001022148.2 hypothetical protein TTHERM_00787090 [Tetrahymena thermophila SB210]
MYQLNWEQKELYYKDFIKKPKNKFSSQWVLQRAMAKAITNRQSKSYHVNKNDMQFCTQRLQLKDWQQSFIMYNQQAEIFKGRKKTDIQIQIELLREYCLQLSGKELKSPEDITQEDIKCLNADIDLFYQQAAQFDSSKEQPSVSSTFKSTQNSNKSIIGSNSHPLYGQVKQGRSGQVKSNIDDEHELGLNTHTSKQSFPILTPQVRINQYNMYDSQATLAASTYKSNQRAFQTISSASQVINKFEDIDTNEQQIQVKKENTTQEAINYINKQNNYNLSQPHVTQQRRPSPLEDQQTYFTHVHNQKTNYHHNQLNNYQSNFQNSSMVNNVNNGFNQYAQVINGNFIGLNQTQEQLVNFKAQQQNQNNFLNNQGVFAQNSSLVNKAKSQVNCQDSEEYIKAKINLDQYQQIIQNDQNQDNLYTIYSHYDNKESLKQNQDNILRENDSDKEIFEAEIENSFIRGINNNSFQPLEDPEQIQYMNPRTNQPFIAQNIESQKLQQYIYDGKNQQKTQQQWQQQQLQFQQYNNHQQLSQFNNQQLQQFNNQQQMQQFNNQQQMQQFNNQQQLQQFNNQQSMQLFNNQQQQFNQQQLPDLTGNNNCDMIIEEKIKHEEISEPQSILMNEKLNIEDFSQINPQDGGELQINYYQYYLNQNNPNNQNSMDDEIDDRIFNNNNISLTCNNSFIYQQLNNSFGYEQAYQSDFNNQQI